MDLSAYLKTSGKLVDDTFSALANKNRELTEAFQHTTIADLDAFDRNLLLAWVLTLPVCVLLGAGTFAFGFFVVLRTLGLQ